MKTIVAITASGAHRAVSIKDTDCPRDAMAEICQGESAGDPVQHFVILYALEGEPVCEAYTRVAKERVRVLGTLQELLQYVLDGDTPADAQKGQNAPSTRRVQ